MTTFTQKKDTPTRKNQAIFTFLRQKFGNALIFLYLCTQKHERYEKRACDY